MSPSPIRCRGPWKLHKRSSEPDRWLDEMGLFRKHIARDSSCLFRAISENIYSTQRYFQRVRRECVQFMASKRHLFEGSLTCPFDNYLKELSNPSVSGGLVEISAMSHLYRRNFVILEANKEPHTRICNGYGVTIYLFYSADTKHFDVVHTKDYINASSFCQSIVYEILYDGVYQLKDLNYAVDKMLHEKVPTNHIEYFMSENVERRKKQKERAKIYIEACRDEKDRNNNTITLKCKHHTEDLERAKLLKESLSIYVFNRSLIQLENICLNCLNVNSAKDLLDNGITPFPYKVAKALDPDIYRNIEFDVWSELRRETRYGVRYSDGTTLQVGVKCLCKLQSDQTVPYHCHIQEMRPDGGPCLVFIEELGEKRVVNYDQLESLPVDEIRPWAPPYRYSRTNSQLLTLNQMLQQIGSISRKQSQGKCRSKSKNIEESKVPEKAKQCKKMSWNEVGYQTEVPDYEERSDLTHQHLDFFNFQPELVEVQALPLMVDCRASSGGTPHDTAQTAPNGVTAGETNNQTGGGSGSGEAGTHSMSSAASTPPNTNTAVVAYSGAANGPGGVTGPSASVAAAGNPLGPGVAPPYMPAACGPYVCGMKPMVWCAPHSPPPPMPAGGHGPPGIAAVPHLGHVPHAVPPPPSHAVNPHVMKSMQANGADLPMADIPTLRYYFNLGVECFWASYGHPPPPPVPRHYTPRDLAQDMQHMGLHDRGGMNHSNSEPKHKQSHANDKANMNSQGKGNGQRPLLGPRFKRGGNNQDNNHNPNNYHNKGPNMGYKGPHNRRNSHGDARMHGAGGGVGGGAGGGYGGGAGAGEGECVMEQQLISVPYIPYPAGPAPPVYPVQYYPIDAEQAGMMGMMSSVGYVSYEESMEYGAMPQYYTAPHHYPLPPPPQPPMHPQLHQQHQHGHMDPK